jgi:hypothetical protein
MSDTNYNVKVLVDVQGKKVMDALAGGGGYASGGSNKTGQKSLSGGIGAAKDSLSKGEGFGTAFETLTKSVTGLAAVMGVGIGVLLMAVGNSKILNTVFGTIGKMLGFLMDVILLPLMPVFMMLVRWLYMLIIQFRNFTKNLSLKSLLEFGLLINPITGIPLWTLKLLQWALGEGTIQTAINFTLGVVQGIGDWLWSVAKWIFFGTVKAVNSVISFAISVGSMFTGFLAGVASFGLSILQWLWGYGQGPAISQIAISFIANPVGWIWSFIQSLWSGGKSLYNIAAGSLGLPKLDTGGTVMETGIAVVHKGETYSGVNGNGQAGSASGGGNTFIFNNYAQLKTEYEMFLKFKDFLRQEGKGLTL